MAAAAVATFDADFRARALLKRDTPQTRIQSAEAHGVQTGIRTLVGFWEGLTGGNEFSARRRRWRRTRFEAESFKDGLKEDVSAKVTPRELLRPYRNEGLDPPSYEECVQDVPPDYTVSAGGGLLAGFVKSCNVAETRRERTRTFS